MLGELWAFIHAPKMKKYLIENNVVINLPNFPFIQSTKGILRLIIKATTMV